MINLGPNAQAAAPAVPVASVKIFGVGGAGLSILERLAGAGLGRAELVAASTDAQALLHSAASCKIQLGREGTKGLGAGGDPVVGESAAKESAAEIRAECAGAQVVVVCAGPRANRSGLEGGRHGNHCAGQWDHGDTGWRRNRERDALCDR